MLYQNLLVFFEIHSKYILPINIGSENQTFILCPRLDCYSQKTKFDSLA